MSIEEGAVVSASVEAEISDSDSATETVAEIVAIIERITDQSFPLVLPSEQSAVDEDAASVLLSWSQKADVVEIQSHLDEQWQQFNSTASIDAGISGPKRQAEWARQHYYVHLQISGKVVLRMNFYLTRCSICLILLWWRPKI
jgi:hypothetical protein